MEILIDDRDLWSRESYYRSDIHCIDARKIADRKLGSVSGPTPFQIPNLKMLTLKDCGESA